MPSKPAKAFVYSYSWAYSVAKEIQRTYPRATDLVYKMLDYKANNMAYLLATYDPGFCKVRSMIHMVDKWLRFDGDPCNTTQLVSSLLLYLHPIDDKGYISRLTAWEKRRTIKSGF